MPVNVRQPLRRSGVRSLLVQTAAAWVVLLLAFPAVAEVRWRNGAESAPLRLSSSGLMQAITELAARPDARRVVVHFDGPVQPAQRSTLESSGLRLLSYLGGNAYFATLAPGADAARLAVMPATVAIESIDPANKLHPDLARGIVHPWAVVSPAATITDETPTVAVYVMFHRDFDPDTAEGVVREHGGTVRSRLQAIDAFVVHLPADRVAGLAGRDDVMYVEPPLPVLGELNDSNRVITEVDLVNAAPYGLDGSGVTVMVYDGGAVFSHADLAGRLTIGQSDTTGISDHATHVACTIGGDGESLGGMAPAVDIVSYGFEGAASGFLYTDPGDLESDYTEAISTYGADLSNNSIGTNTAINGFPCSWEGNYGTTGALIDEVVRGALGDPFRIVWANGNERSSGICGSTYLTTAPPACAKNHLTVGALNSNDDTVTGFTSWGPCDDGRLKPDVSAPGCQSGGDGGVTSCSSSGGYTVKCGTSMASPTAAGVASLLLQQFRQSFPARPDFRNSLLRAVLAQTAADVGNTGPDYQTGYGSIRATAAADAIIAERFVEDSVTQGEVYSFALTVAAGEEVEVTLAWDDPAGTPDVDPVLVNDLDLRIVGPDQTVYYPWTLDPDNPSAAAVQTVRDSVNNIEQVRIPNGGGTYTVQIEGFNIAEGPEQSFGLAASHTPIFCSEQPTFTGVHNVVAGDSCGEIDLSWSAASSNCSPEGTISYNVYRSTGVLFNPQPSNRVHQGVGATTLTDAGLEPGVEYIYIVRAVDAQSGEDANVVKQSAVTPQSPDLGAPIFSGLLSASAGAGCGEVVLEWPAAIETCSGPTLYEVHRSSDVGFIPGPGTLVATTFATGFIDTSVVPGETNAYLVRATDGVGNADTNGVRLEAAPTVFDLPLLQTEFEPSAAGWSLGTPNDAVTGTWAWGNPMGTAYQPEDDATPTGVNCWITGLSTEPTNGDVDDGTTTLLSATYDLSDAVAPKVGYSRWFSNDRGNNPGQTSDTLRVEVSNNDGQSWSMLEEVGTGTPLAWVPVAHLLPVAGTSQVRFRFTTADLNGGSLVEAGVDDFSLVDDGQQCRQCSGPPAVSLCGITIDRSGDDVVVNWTSHLSGLRAVVYQVNGCAAGGRLRLGTATGNSFVHESAALASGSFNYRVTFVDSCGNEQAFCGATNCP